MKTLPKDPSPIFDLMMKSEREMTFLVGLFFWGLVFLGESLDGIESVYGFKISQMLPIIKF